MADSANFVVIARRLGHAIERAVANEAVLLLLRISIIIMLDPKYRISRLSG
jgi:hypothetical protein